MWATELTEDSVVSTAQVKDVDHTIEQHYLEKRKRGGVKEQTGAATRSRGISDQ